jgi:Cellulase (glycosyl hydrolase family 5)
VEGVQYLTGEEKASPSGLFHWWGGNLEGVKDNPVRLNISNKLVYSPHEYGEGVYPQPWFYESTFPQNLYNRWQTGFQYIADEGIAPIFIGEFGGYKVDNISKEGIWQRTLVDFINQKNLSFAYWSWNPNSDNTGGILLDDWRTVDAAKQQLLNTLLPVPTLRTSAGLSPSSPSFSTATDIANKFGNALNYSSDITQFWAEEVSSAYLPTNETLADTPIIKVNQMQPETVLEYS